MPGTQPEPIGRPKEDHLLTPVNCALLLIDYQPRQYHAVTSAGKEEINLNAVALCRLATAFDVPVIVSTVGVDMGVKTGTEAELLALLPGIREIDRTEVCLTLPTLDMLAEGHEVYPVADAVDGISPVAHDRAFDRMIQAGATPVTAT